LYLYLYNPAKEKIYSDMQAYLYFNGEYKAYNFTLVNKDDTLCKYRMNVDDKEKIRDYVENNAVRNYYVGRLVINRLLSKLTVDVCSHFEYSNEAFDESYNKPMFVANFGDFVYSNPGMKAGDFIDFYISNTEYSGFDFEVTNGSFNVIDNNYFEIKILEDCDSVYISDLNGYSYFPEFGYPEITPYAAKQGDADSVGELTRIGVTGESIGGGINNNSIAGSTTMVQIHSDIPAVDTNYDEVYVRAITDEVINIKCEDTFYRLDSSVSGNGYFQTLTSVYFSLPYEYMEMSNNDKYDDRYVSAIHYAYEHAMSQPIIYTSDKESFNNLKSVLGKELDNVALVTNPILQGDSLGLAHYLCKYLIGVKTPKVGALLYNSYIPQIYYEKLNAVRLTNEFDENAIFDVVDSAGTVMIDGTYEKEVNILDFKDTKSLLSYKDVTLNTLQDDFGFLAGWWYHMVGIKDDAIAESMMDIPVIQTLNKSECEAALEMSVDEFWPLFSALFFSEAKNVSSFSNSSGNEDWPSLN
jgi:hypothetical protein